MLIKEAGVSVLRTRSLVGWFMAAAGFGAAAWSIREARRDEKMFRDLLDGLTFGANPGAVLQRIAERATKLVGGIAAYVERIDAERGEIVAAAFHDGHGLPPAGTRGPYKGSVAE